MSVADRTMPDRRRMYLQAPVGNCTSIEGLVSSRCVATQGLSAIKGWSSYWYDSGTMALAIAVQAARTALEKQKPAVVLAAYGCPDVVAAIKWVDGTVIDCVPQIRA